MRSISLNQRTIAAEAVFGGLGLQTGRKVEVRCRPAAADEGIVFRRRDIPGSPEIKLSDAALSKAKRRSALRVGRTEVQTIEHFLAALWALEIDNVTVEMDAPEMPAMDGSAKAYLETLGKAGIKDSDIPREIIKVTEPVVVRARGCSLAVYPHDGFRVSYLIDYPVRSIGRELFEIDLDKKSFETEVAPARTFCLKKEAELLLKLGFGKGATLENTLVMDEEGPVGTKLRFPDEPVRHKILDLVGDLYMLGRPVIGRVVAEKSGHRLNAMLVKELYERYVKPEERKKDKGKRIKEKSFSDFLLSPLSFLLAKRKDD